MIRDIATLAAALRATLQWVFLMATFHILNFGCRASQADGAALRGQLLEAGLFEASDSTASDVAILNTCTVTATADAEVRQMIRRIHRENPGCRIVVTGCYAQRAPQEVSRLQGVACVVGNSHKHRMAEIIHGSPALLHGPAAVAAAANIPSSTRLPGEPDSDPPAQSSPAWVGDIGQEFHFLPAWPADRTRPTLKIQDGCNARCSFCIIPAVRGRSRSLPPAQVIAQIREMERIGYKEVVLSGINLGSYGRDLGPGTAFLGLLKQILDETAIPRLRISSIEPMDVSTELIRLVACEPRLADHFHVPLQSGSDRVLRQMNRRYWTSQYAERVRSIREMIPHGGIGADVMVGFPGETSHDHAASVRLIGSLPFTYLHIFPYSSRPSTPAAERKDHIEGRVARERGVEVRSLIARKRQEFLATQLGRVLSAVTLGKSQRGETTALSSNYLSCTLPGCDVAPNCIVNVRARRICEDSLWGDIEESPRL